jgi:hypothetical protein
MEGRGSYLLPCIPPCGLPAPSFLTFSFFLVRSAFFLRARSFAPFLLFLVPLVSLSIVAFHYLCYLFLFFHIAFRFLSCLLLPVLNPVSPSSWLPVSVRGISSASTFPSFVLPPFSSTLLPLPGTCCAGSGGGGGAHTFRLQSRILQLSQNLPRDSPIILTVSGRSIRALRHRGPHCGLSSALGPVPPASYDLRCFRIAGSWPHP